MKRKITLLALALLLCGCIALLLCGCYNYSSNKAVSVVHEKYNVNVTNTPKLMIYYSSPRHLAWYIETDSIAPDKVYVNALSGEIIYADYPPGLFRRCVSFNAIPQKILFNQGLNVSLFHPKSYNIITIFRRL